MNIRYTLTTIGGPPKLLTKDVFGVDVERGVINHYAKTNKIYKIVFNGYDVMGLDAVMLPDTPLHITSSSKYLILELIRMGPLLMQTTTEWIVKQHNIGLKPIILYVDCDRNVAKLNIFKDGRLTDEKFGFDENTRWRFTGNNIIDTTNMFKV